VGGPVKKSRTGGSIKGDIRNPGGGWQKKKKGRQEKIGTVSKEKPAGVGRAGKSYPGNWCLEYVGGGPGGKNGRGKGGGVKKEEGVTERLGREGQSGKKRKNEKKKKKYNVQNKQEVHGHLQHKEGFGAKKHGGPTAERAFGAKGVDWGRDDPMKRGGENQTKWNGQREGGGDKSAVFPKKKTE